MCHSLSHRHQRPARKRAIQRATQSRLFVEADHPRAPGARPLAKPLQKTKKSVSYYGTVTVPKGKYVWKVYAADQKHRKQISVGWSTLTVK
jgi:hypothetical protein